MQGSLHPKEVEAAIASFPPSELGLHHLYSEAEGVFWEAPHRCWALALLAHTAAQQWQSPAWLQARSALLLGQTLNLLGRFSNSLSPLATANTLWLEQGWFDEVSRCQSEIAKATLFLGHFTAAEQSLEQARRYATTPFALACCEQAEGMLWLEKNEHLRATDCFQAATTRLSSLGKPREWLLTSLELAKSVRFSDVQAAQERYEQTLTLPSRVWTPILVAYRQHTHALIELEAHASPESLASCQQVRERFAEHGMVFMVAECDAVEALIRFWQDDYEGALACYQRARQQFVALDLADQISRCDMNIALIVQLTHQYDEALTLYGQVVARESERGYHPFRIALGHTNMGLCYEQVGRYDLALLAHHRALQFYAQIQEPLYYTAHCYENLAGTYRALGRYDLALEHYQEALVRFQQGNAPTHLASHHTQVAELYLMMEQPEQAVSYLKAACQIYAEAGLMANLGACRRLLGQTTFQLGDAAGAMEQLAEARRLLLGQGLVVSGALCDLVEGEIRLAIQDFTHAATLFRAISPILGRAFPDHAWRVEVGLGQCALADGDPTTALQHYRRAIQFIRQTRDTLPTERLSSDFFARRHHVFDAGVLLAVRQSDDAAVLEIIETCKAHTLLGPRRPAPKPRAGDDPLLDLLQATEGRLRYQISALRADLLSPAQNPPPASLIQRSDADALDTLTHLSEEYEAVIERLRVATAAVPTSVAKAFSLASFRAMAEHLPARWGCLEYFLVGGHLIIVYLDPQTVRVHHRELDSWIQGTLLRQGTSNEPERRELIYGGTLHGRSMTERGLACRQRLGHLLFPPSLVDSSALDLLIIVPHGILHGLPFHALFVQEERLLLEEVPLVYAPSLRTLQRLWSDGDRVRSVVGAKTLLCGLESFGGMAHALPHTRQELHQIQRTLGAGAEILYGEAATLGEFQVRAAEGNLAQYDMLHFATHAVAVPRTPMLSRILLHKSDLTVSDILAMNLSARLVTLSACQGAVGEIGAGDQVMTLAQAFFHAGAQAVVASLWSVEDRATSLLMGYFYSALQDGLPIPEALRQAQLTMHRSGYPPYHWAPFVVVGNG